MPVLNSLALLSYNFGILNGDASTTGPKIEFNKARSLTGGPVVSGDTIGEIYFGGADSGGTFSRKLGIQAVSTGTIGADRIPFNLNFYTAQNAALAPQVLRMVISTEGGVGISKGDNDTQTIGTPTTTLGVLGSSLLATNNQANTDGAYAALLKNRAAGAVVTGDALGTLGFVGRSTTTEVLSASIGAVSTGTIGAAKVPSDMFFRVMDDATGTLNTRMAILEDGLVLIDEQLSIGGDLGSGAASSVDFTNVTDLTANGAGTFTVKSKSANNLDSSGFLKIYVNGTIYYIPLFNAVAP